MAASRAACTSSTRTARRCRASRRRPRSRRCPRCPSTPMCCSAPSLPSRRWPTAPRGRAARHRAGRRLCRGGRRGTGAAGADGRGGAGRGHAPARAEFDGGGRPACGLLADRQRRLWRARPAQGADGALVAVGLDAGRADQPGAGARHGLQPGRGGRQRGGPRRRRDRPVLSRRPEHGRLRAVPRDDPRRRRAGALRRGRARPGQAGDRAES